MGRDKADVTISGSTMLDRVHRALTTATSRVVLMGPDRAGFECWPDAVHASGPLAGVATALARMGEDRLLAVAVDHAFVRAETLKRLAAIESDLPVVPVDESGVRQVTCALYQSSIA
jgi:molybdopterin-guanine dinucleotide biosynthesis protein A